VGVLVSFFSVPYVFEGDVISWRTGRPCKLRIMMDDWSVLEWQSCLFGTGRLQRFPLDYPRSGRYSQV
jgi:hypothetical protein